MNIVWITMVESLLRIVSNVVLIVVGILLIRALNRYNRKNSGQ
jgi:hypothetical protein